MLQKAGENGCVPGRVSPAKLSSEHLWLSVRLLPASLPLSVMLCSALVESLAEFLPPW